MLEKKVTVKPDEKTSFIMLLLFSYTQNVGTIFNV